MDYSECLPETRDNEYQKLAYRVGNQLVQTSAQPLMEMDKDIQKIEFIRSVLDGYQKRYHAVAKCKDLSVRANMHKKLDREMQKLEDDVRSIKKSLDDWKVKAEESITKADTSTLSNAEKNLIDHFELKYIKLYIEFMETKHVINDYRMKANLFIGKRLHPELQDEWEESLKEMTFDTVDKKLILMQHMDSAAITESDLLKIEKANQRARKVEQEAQKLKEKWEHVETIVMMNQQTFDKVSSSIDKTKNYVQKTEKELKVAAKMQSAAIRAKMYTIIMVLCAIGGVALFVFLILK